MKFTIEELEAHLAEVVERLKELDAEYADQPLPEGARDEWDRLREERKATEGRIKEQRERKAYLASIEGKDAHEERGTEERYTFSTRTKQSPFDLEQYRGDARDPQSLTRSMKDGAKRALETLSFPAQRGISREDHQEHIERLLDAKDTDGDLARRVLVTGSPLYQRAFGKYLTGKTLNAEEQRALSLADANGGYAVPVQLDPTVILTGDGSINPLRSLARVEQIVGKEWQGVTSAGITVSRDTEAAEVSDDAPTLAQPTVSTNKVQGFVPFSIEVGQDWAGLQTEITALLADAKNEEEANSFVLGDGTGTAPNGIVATLAASSHVVTAGSGAFADDDVYATEEDLGPRFRQRASWLASKTIYNKVRQFDTSGGSALWERIGAGQPPELLGYPAFEQSEMSATVSAGELILLFGDFSKFLIVDRIGMSVELIPHLFATGNNRPSGQRGIYAYWRNNCEILVDNAFRLLKVKS